MTAPAAAEDSHAGRSSPPPVLRGSQRQQASWMDSQRVRVPLARCTRHPGNRAEADDAPDARAPHVRGPSSPDGRGRIRVQARARLLRFRARPKSEAAPSPRLRRSSSGPVPRLWREPSTGAGATRAHDSPTRHLGRCVALCDRCGGTVVTGRRVQIQSAGSVRAGAQRIRVSARGARALRHAWHPDACARRRHRAPAPRLLGGRSGGISRAVLCGRRDARCRRYAVE